MATYFMFGNTSIETLKEISAKRTDKAVALIKKYGGEVKSMHCLLGKPDLVLVLDLPNTEQAMKTSIALSKLTGISFSTSPAVDVADFDKMVDEM